MKVYTTDRSNDRSEPERIKVGVADYAVAHAGSTLVTSGLGSCVGIALADVEAGVAGLAHAMLPSASAELKREEAADDVHPDVWKYVDTAVPELVRELADAGAERARIEGRLAGGSAMFEFESSAGAVGERNVAAAREALDASGIPLVDSDVGGDYGRSLSFDVEAGELSIRRAHGETHVI
jgi:chemotaxis protein CheD